LLLPDGKIVVGEAQSTGAPVLVEVVLRVMIEMIKSTINRMSLVGWIEISGLVILI
jgi:hypothetical protein